MRLYHRPVLLLGAALVLLSACSPPAVTADLIAVRITADGSTAAISVSAGSTVQDVLAAAGLTAASPDRTEPPLYTVLTEDGEIRVVRVTEEFSVEEAVIPFDKQLVRNEALPEGETRLIQPGVNGIHEITVRRLYEDGVEVSSGTVKTVVIQEAVPEIIMVGSQTPFTQVEITGRLAYLSGGNAWVMEGSTGSRRPVVTTGDLDGQVFRLSPDAEWLLFTRRSEEEGQINELWVARVAGGDEQMIDLGARNIIHFADWVPTSVLRVAYSTVEPRETAPGWQANNDLRLLSFSTSGWVARPTVALDANAGGIYGWWGTTFALAPDGVRLAYARPDGVGVLDLRENVETFLQPILEMPALNTGSDWAWVPGLAWAPTGNILFTVNHAAPSGGSAVEESQQFDLTALPLEAGGPIPLSPGTGMFAYPAASPIIIADSGELSYQLAFLQAVFPDQSESSRYRLVVMDRDGSNRRVLFPAEGEPGLLPQQVLWSPELLPESSGFWIGFLYNGNLFLVDTAGRETFQLTGDGLIDRLDWR
jgi:hypothetical protein